MSGIMETIYGSFARMFTVLIATAFSLLMIISELKSVGYMGVFMGLSYRTMVIIIGFLVIPYTALGGVRSVIFTDVVQFVVFFGGLYFGFAVIWHWGGVFTI